MENLNHALYFWLNAPEHPNTLVLMMAVFVAEWLIWTVPLGIGIGWLRGKENTRKVMHIATAAGMLGLFVNQIIGLAWLHPRPFMIGLGHTFLPHVNDSSFPSDHLTLWWAVAFSFLMQQRQRTVGIAMALFGVPIAWARIYLGVHFPLDMLGAVVVATLSAWLAMHGARWYLMPAYRLAIDIYYALFGSLIERGWFSE
ncbi:MAG: undecaprenyl-diphosphatase [Aquabacterium sp.]|uniref:undecaprenyl-diphosphatase n=1 Tax=Aquabacterium sp. TaxID=1872578 RepID=UPI0012074910|nr:undecaprenyl-diphosphatase [Aquabacterium sp.]TAK92685.1 MAG: undecaprenyl-diphosphatase [Aquabacterium sp.]